MVLSPSLKVLVGILQLIFVHVSCILCVVFFVFYIFRIVLKIILLSATASSGMCFELFCHTLKKTVSISFYQLGLTRYLVICLCLFWNYVSVSNLNFLMLFLLLFLILSIHKWYFPIIFSIAFHFHRHYIIKHISPSIIKIIPRHLFLFKRINKLDGVDGCFFESGKYNIM